MCSLINESRRGNTFVLASKHTYHPRV